MAPVGPQPQINTSVVSKAPEDAIVKSRLTGHVLLRPKGFYTTYRLGIKHTALYRSLSRRRFNISKLLHNMRDGKARLIAGKAGSRG